MARFERDGKVFEITSNDTRYKSELRAHLREGWTRVVDPRCEEPLGAEPRNPVLEDALRADPDDLGTKLVYADWLQQQGHPRGALIAVQHRLAQTPGDRELVEAERRILVDAGDALISKALLANFGLWRGTAEIERLGNFYAGGKITFDHGFIREAKVDLRQRTADEDALWELVRHPSARALAKLHVELDASRDIDLVAALLLHGPELPLRSLALLKTGAASATLSLARLGVVYPLLEELEVRTSYVRFAGASLPHLRKLALWTIDSDVGVAVEEMPALEDLTLDKPDPDKLEVAFERGMVPNLRRIAFVNSQSPLHVLRLAWRIGGQLESITMRRTYAGGSSTEFLVVHRARFPQLAELRIDATTPPADIDRLRAAGYAVSLIAVT